MRTLRMVAVASAALAPLAAGGPAYAADAAPPKVPITTPPGALLVAPVSAVTGRASDDAAGIAGVRVTFCGNASAHGGGWSCGSGPLGLSVVETYDATVTCTSSTRRSCTWSVPVPLRPDRYLVVATATDLAGRTASAGPVDVVVV